MRRRPHPFRTTDSAESGHGPHRSVYPPYRHLKWPHDPHPCLRILYPWGGANVGRVWNSCTECRYLVQVKLKLFIKEFVNTRLQSTYCEDKRKVDSSIQELVTHASSPVHPFIPSPALSFPAPLEIILAERSAINRSIDIRSIIICIIFLIAVRIRLCFHRTVYRCASSLSDLIDRRPADRTVSIHLPGYFAYVKSPDSRKIWHILRTRHDETAITIRKGHVI